MTASAVPVFKAALQTFLTTVYASQSPPVLISYGHPGGPNLPNDIVAIRDAHSDQVWAPMGQQRKEETIEQQLVVSCVRGGTDQKVVTERAYALLDLLDAAIRKPAGDPTVGGVCRWAVLGKEIDLAETTPDRFDMTKGRVAEVVATITAKVRI